MIHADVLPIWLLLAIRSITTPPWLAPPGSQISQPNKVVKYLNYTMPVYVELDSTEHDHCPGSRSDSKSTIAHWVVMTVHEGLLGLTMDLQRMFNLSDTVISMVVHVDGVHKSEEVNVENLLVVLRALKVKGGRIVIWNGPPAG